MLTYAAKMGENQNHGIVAQKNGEVLQEIWDISPDFTQVEYLAQKLNQGQVSLIHFLDVVQDYVVQGAMG